VRFLERRLLNSVSGFELAVESLGVNCFRDLEFGETSTLFIIFNLELMALSLCSSCFLPGRGSFSSWFLGVANRLWIAGSLVLVVFTSDVVEFTEALTSPVLLALLILFNAACLSNNFSLLLCSGLTSFSGSR